MVKALPLPTALYCDLNHIWLNPKSISEALGRKVKRRLERSYAKLFNEKLADPTSSSIKIHVGKQGSGAINYEHIN